MDAAAFYINIGVGSSCNGGARRSGGSNAHIGRIAAAEDILDSVVAIIDMDGGFLILFWLVSRQVAAAEDCVDGVGLWQSSIGLKSLDVPFRVSRRWSRRI